MNVRTVVPKSPNIRKKKGRIITTKNMRVVCATLICRPSAPEDSPSMIISFNPPGTAEKKAVRGSNFATNR